MKLWRSGIIWTVLTFVSGLGNFVFSRLIFSKLSGDDYGDVNSILGGFVSYLGLPASIAGQALIHYLAHFRGKNDDARLQGLLAGSQKFLLQATIAGSILSLLLAGPLARFVHFRSSLTLAALVTIMAMYWSSYAMALCQGMAWFRRMAIIDLAGVALKIGFFWLMAKKYATAEMAVLATAVFFLTKLSLLYWWTDIFKHSAERVSPWNREFVSFLLVTAAYVVGNCCFMTGDSLVAKKYFPDHNTNYQVATRWGLALVGNVLPLLQVMFTSRSTGLGGQAKTDQRILLALYGAGLAAGAGMLILFRDLLVRLICGGANPEASAVMAPYVITMVFVGLGQAIGLWSLASRWGRVTTLYGALGVTYWLVLLGLGHSLTSLLRVMPITTGAALAILLASWMLSYRRQSSVQTEA